MLINTRAKANSITISSMLPVLVKLEHFRASKDIHGINTRMGIEDDVFNANSTDMCSKSGHTTEASNVFYKMSENNVVSRNAMVSLFNKIFYK